MANSYFATYKSIDGKTLVGGVLNGKTSRFGNRKDAEIRLEQTIEINSGRATGQIHESILPPEIFTHCGSIAQTIGGKCFRCGKVLTPTDAKQSMSNFEIGEVVVIDPEMRSAVVKYLPRR